MNRSEQAVRRAENDLAQREAEVQKLGGDLDLALHKEKDDIARLLIRKRRSLDGSCDQLKHQIEALTKENDRLSETLARQRLHYDGLKLKVTAFRQQAQAAGYADAIAFDEAIAPEGSPQPWGAPTEEEIELELLQRKEALQEGGTR
jgi:phage shock protein A